MQPSRIDPCIWYKDDIVLVIYVDNCLLFSRNKVMADELIEKLSATFIFIDEGDKNTYLDFQVGLNDKDNMIELKQPLLIKIIIEALK